MTPVPRHQCLIYDGAPSRHLPMLAIVTREKLKQNFRCLYLNSAPMVAGMGSYLAAADVDVAREIEAGHLVLSSAQSHLIDGMYFDPERMISTLEATLDRSLKEGYAGLWATGDMTWEIGPTKDFSQLLEYEWRLEECFRTHPELAGVCQYHAQTLPRTVVRAGLHAHPGLFVSETLSLLNPHYLQSEDFSLESIANPELEDFLDRLSSSGPTN